MFKKFLFFSALTVLYILLNRYDYLIGPQKYFIQKILQVQDPSLYQRDVLTTLQNQTYYTFLAWPLAAAAHWIDLRWLFFIGHLLTTYFYLYGVFELGRFLFKNWEIAFLCVLGVFFIKPVLIDSSLYPTVFYHRNVSWALQIFSVLYFLKLRPVLSGLFLGLSFCITPYAAAHLVLIFAFVLLAQRDFLTFKQIFQGAVSFTVFALPMVVWRLAQSGDIPLLNPPVGWISLLKLTASIYCFPTSLLNPDNGQLTTFILALIWPLFFAASFLRGFLKREGIHQTVWLLMGGILFLFLLGTVFSEVLPVAAVIQLQFFRSHRFFVLLAILYFSHYLVRRFHEEGSWDGRIFVGALLAAFLSSKMILCTLLALIDNFRKRWIRTLALGGLMVMSLIPRPVQPALLDRLFHLDAAFLLACAGTWFFLNQRKKSAVIGFVYASFLILILIPTYWRIERPFLKNPVGTLARQIEWPWTSRIPAAYEAFFQWVRGHTDPGALFLTPPQALFVKYFSVETRRSEVLSLEGSVSATSFAYALEWQKRMQDFDGFPIESFEERYLQLPPERLKELKERYAFDYFVTLKGATALDWPIAFQNEEIIAYRVPS